MIDSILNMDCIDGLRQIPDGSVDLIVTDPPYSFDSLSGGGLARVRNYFDMIEPMSDGLSDDILNELLRVLKKPNLYIWGNWKAILGYLDYFRDKEVYTNLLSWHKSNPAPLCNNQWLKDTEYCLYIRAKGVRLFGGFHDHRTYWITTNNITQSTKYGHPTVKPLEIIQTMVKNSSEGGGDRVRSFHGFRHYCRCV